MRLNLANKTLKIGFINNLPYVLLKWSPRTRSYSVIGGTEARMIYLLSQYFQFTIEWIQMRQFGEKAANGTWSGLIGRIASKQIDMGVGGIGQTYQRNMVVDFFYPFKDDTLTFANRFIPNEHGIHLLWQPFHLYVWLVFFLTFITFWMFDRLRTSLIIPMSYTRKRKSFRPRMRKNHNLLWINLYLLTRQPYCWLASTPISIQIGSIVWAISAMVLTNFYLGFLCSMLALPTGSEIDTIDKLVKASQSGQMVPLGNSNTSVVEFFSTTKIESFQVLWKHVQLIPTTFIGIQMIISQQSLYESKRQEYAIISTRERLQYFQLHVGKDILYIPPNTEEASFFSIFVSIPIRQRFPYQKPFEQILGEIPFNIDSISRLFHMGIIEHWQNIDNLRIRIHKLDDNKYVVQHFKQWNIYFNRHRYNKIKNKTKSKFEFKKYYYDPNELTLFSEMLHRLMLTDPGRQLILNCMTIFDSADFDQTLSKFEYKHWMTHIGSGSYADVFRFPINNSQSTVILKVIRLLPEVVLDRLETSNIARISPYMEAYNEYQILSSLSLLNTKLKYKNAIYSCQMFPRLLEGFLVRGSLPKYFRIKSKLMEDDESLEESTNNNEDNKEFYNEYVSNSSIFLNDSLSSTESKSELYTKKESNPPLYQDVFRKYQLQSGSIENFVILMEDCGEPIGNWIQNMKPYTTLSIIKQIITGLMISESVFQFEHRDLHSGNVLLQPINYQFIYYTFCGKKAFIPSHGFLVKIIDTTFSRIEIDHKVYFKDLTYLFKDNPKEILTEEQMDERQMCRLDIVYQQMYQLISDDWYNFYPKTNLFWIKYIINKLLKAPIFKNEFNQEAQQAKHILEQYKELSEQCSSCQKMFHKIINDEYLNEFCEIVIQ